MIRKMLENYPDTLSVEEVMSVLGIGKHTVKKWIKENKVDWKKIDTKYVISKQSLIKMFGAEVTPTKRQIGGRER